MASSRCREVARASIRLPTLKQAMSRTTETAAKSSIRLGRTARTVSSWNGIGVKANRNDL